MKKIFLIVFLLLITSVEGAIFGYFYNQFGYTIQPGERFPIIKIKTASNLIADEVGIIQIEETGNYFIQYGVTGLVNATNPYFQIALATFANGENSVINGTSFFSSTYSKEYPTGVATGSAILLLNSGTKICLVNNTAPATPLTISPIKNNASSGLDVISYINIMKISE